MVKRFFYLLVVTSSYDALAQIPTATICNWKNDAQGAYTINHDDYGDIGVIGINNFVDTMARNRNLKITFGAITSACENNPGMWSQAVSMVNYGHEIINHSHNHTCSIYQSWCTAGLWAENATINFSTEMDLSSNLIKSKTGIYPRYFIYPYDLYNLNANNHLKSLGYIGARTGNYNSADANNFAPDADGFFQASLVVDAITVNNDIVAVNLDSWADYAADNNSWVNRELHNVGNTGWGHVTESDYRNHLNHVKTKVNQNELWVGTASEVLTYQIQKLNYTPTVQYDDNKKEVLVNWNTPSFDVENYLKPLQFKSAITLKVDMIGWQGNYVVTQNNQTITINKRIGNLIFFDVYPHEGAVKISVQKYNEFTMVRPIQNIVSSVGATVNFAVEVSPAYPITYTWYKNNVLLPGETNAKLTLKNIQASDVASYKVVAKCNNKTLTSEAKLEMSNQTPYHGSPAIIPGIIEFEEYDFGGQQVSYYDNSTGNDGNAFRYDDVDIESMSNGGYDIGWTNNGEWMEYTVNITKSGSYDVDITHAALSANGSIKLYINDVVVAGILSLPLTNSYTSFQTSTFSNINLNSGIYVLKVRVVNGDVNLDKMVFKLNNFPITKIANLKIQAYPNPFQQSFIVKLSAHGAQKIQLLTIEGKLLEEYNNVHDYVILGNHLANGVYILNVLSEDEIDQIKMVKQE
jgi:hypothetical protein